MSQVYTKLLFVFALFITFLLSSFLVREHWNARTLMKRREREKKYFCCFPFSGLYRWWIWWDGHVPIVVVVLVVVQLFKNPQVIPNRKLFIIIFHICWTRLRTCKNAKWYFFGFSSMSRHKNCLLSFHYFCK